MPQRVAERQVCYALGQKAKKNSLVCFPRLGQCPFLRTGSAPRAVSGGWGVCVSCLRGLLATQLGAGRLGGGTCLACRRHTPPTPHLQEGNAVSSPLCRRCLACFFCTGAGRGAAHGPATTARRAPERSPRSCDSPCPSDFLRKQRKAPEHLRVWCRCVEKRLLCEPEFDQRFSGG